MNPSTGYDKRHCVRCGADTLGGANRPEHLCADIAKRLKRREAQRAAVLDVFSRWGLLDGYEETKTRLAEAIVKELAGMDVTSD